jgi:CheY-like chemotaxis protein
MSPRILIIDDEAHIRQMMRLTLETAGYEVGEASDGLHGLEVFDDGMDWDIVLLDQRMPGMDGLETLRRLKERHAEVRVIMVTAYASIELAVDAMKLGATDFVRKPMTPEILRNTVAAALAKGGIVKARAPRSRQPSIETLTMNGFHIFTLETHAPHERRFLVKNPAGIEGEVYVDIGAENVATVERLTRRALPFASSFWTVYAERTLAAYLWDEGKIPAHRLTVIPLNRNDLDTAARWKEPQEQTWDNVL